MRERRAAARSADVVAGAIPRVARPHVPSAAAPARVAHRFAQLDVEPNRAPIQRWEWPWAKKKKDLLLNHEPPFTPDPYAYLDERDPDAPDVAPVRLTPGAKAGLGFKLSGGTASTVGGAAMLSNLAGAGGTAAQVASAGGVGGAVLGAPASLLSAGVTAARLRRGGETGADQAAMGSSIVSDLGSATQNAGSGILAGGKILPGAVGGALGSVASATTATLGGVGGLATGAFDVGRGIYDASAGRARSDALNRLAVPDRGGNLSGAAGFAARGQETKADAGKATVAKGLLGLGGGAALVAGLAGAAAISNPIGWGLLAGAAVVGAGIGAYKLHRKHKLGNEILAQDSDMRRQLGAAGINLTSDDMKQKPWYKTAGMHAHDVVRAKVAARLAERREGDVAGPNGDVSDAILKHLGLRSRDELERDPEKRRAQIEESMDI